LSLTGIGDRFAEHAADWEPLEFFRAKNIGNFRWNPQLELFAGVLPELESQIQDKLSPMLRDAMSFAAQVYQRTADQEPDDDKLFKLIFSLLTGKVFHDRDVHGFKGLGIGDGADAVLEAVARQYREPASRLLNKPSRDAAFSRIWPSMNFRNLSVEVLAELWSTALVTPEVRKEYGIHRTPRTIAKYIVDRMPFNNVDDDHRIVLEPCCGSAVFLVAAMNRLRQQQWGLSPRARHDYFTQHLVGYEVEPFGVEISKLALTLADFPNPRDWQIRREDIFSPLSTFPRALLSAGAVLCNPPFEAFTPQQRERYRPSSPKKPVELLNIILKFLHPRGVLGLVLPRNVIDGREYKRVRKQLASRFSSIEITSLPDQAFAADHEVALLIAQQPIPHRATTVRHRQVDDTPESWRNFDWRHEVSSEFEAKKTVEDCADSLAIPKLFEVWSYLTNCNRLGQIAELHRGIEWNLPLTEQGQETGNRQKLVSYDPKPGFALGVPPEAAVHCFTTPDLRYIDMRKKSQRGNAYQQPWEKPKVILNAVTKSRRGWRIAAFADIEGIPGYQNITGVWPHEYDVVALAAVLNGPIANAYVATREGKKHITIETLKGIPVPALLHSQVAEIRGLVEQYLSLSGGGNLPLWSGSADQELVAILKRIDSIVLSAYNLPPRLERKALDYFNEASRAVPFVFGDYFPRDFEPCIPLSDYISPDYALRTAKAFRSDRSRPPEHIMEALAYAAGIESPS
jgi:hypothetical protein